jgi:hypothetical protein
MTPHRLRTSVPFLLCVLLTLACSEWPLATRTGTWGGAFGFRLQADRHATSFSYGCTSADAGPLRPDALGRFSVGGLTVATVNNPSVPAFIVGHVKGDTLFAGLFTGAVPESLPALPFGLANVGTDYSGYQCAMAAARSN